MKTLAAVLVELGKPLELADLDVPALKPGQTLVEIACSGVCHTQVLEVRGRRGVDRFLPHCLGHEGSGTVVDIGPGVTRVQPGDRVVLSWIKAGGIDVPGAAYQWNGRTVNAGAITTFSQFSVISENRLTKLDPAIPFDLAALLGCAIPTGMGTVFNSAQVRPGQSVAVFGTGGVGLCAVAAAAVSGATPVIAIDVNADKLAVAQTQGATHSINPNTTEVVAEIQRLCPGGVDVAIEATGRPAVMQQALEAVRPQGGLAVIAGNASFGEQWLLDPRLLNQGKRIVGTWGGDNQPDRDFPRYQRLLVAGRLSVTALLSGRYALTQVNDAIDDLEHGRAVRPMIDMTQ